MRLSVEAGAVIAGLRVERPLGEGATGAVYLARDPDGTAVALKLLAPELSRDERFRKRFLREMKVVAAVTDQHIVRVMGCGEDDGFPPRLAEALLHIILSHHGQLEHGSPVVPCTREATLVHFLDNLGGRLGSFDRLEKELPAGALWSGYDRALGSNAFFGAPNAAPHRLEAA